MRFQINNLVVDTATRSAALDGAPIDLSDLSYAALAKLVEAAPSPVSHVELSRDVWAMDHVSEDTIAQRIALLRRTIGDNAKRPIYIRTVRGAGYAIAGPVVRLDEDVGAGRRRPISTTWPKAAAAGLVAGAGLLALASATSWRSDRPAAAADGANAGSETDLLVQRAQSQLRLHQARETDRALDILSTALEADPNSFDARLTYSLALTTRSTKFGGGEADKREAEEIARSLVEERPDDSAAWSALGYALDAQGRSAESLPAYQVAYRIDPLNAGALSSAAYTHMVLGDLYAALQLEVRARKSGRSSRYSEIQIALALELLNHPSMARWQRRALELNPGQVVVLSELARSHLRRGDPDGALEILSEADGQDGSAPSILTLKGRAAMMHGRTEEARDFFVAAGGKGAFDLAALNALQGDRVLAERFLGPAKLSDLAKSTWPGGRVHLAEISMAMGRPQEARRLLDEAISLGWRDSAWLKTSPFLSGFMASQDGLDVDARINRELEAQRLLIEDARELAPIFGG